MSESESESDGESAGESGGRNALAISVPVASPAHSTKPVRSRGTPAAGKAKGAATVQVAIEMVGRSRATSQFRAR